MLPIVQKTIRAFRRYFFAASFTYRFLTEEKPAMSTLLFSMPGNERLERFISCDAHRLLIPTTIRAAHGLLNRHLMFTSNRHVSINEFLSCHKVRGSDPNTLAK
ncbi:hypothetical protein CLF_103454 [Clonorchis sinensis]|uniref:Uncharacterized protein n=1 Tax=Clonorchis sinensis TaxID=79923 RepID=G7Y9S4_CLOSI|nr:hypothetical protein CLF_103454 [Clonorchis sinensis]